MDRILLASDLDRTIIPNGDAPESSAARPLLRRLAERDEVTLIYITGRDQELIKQAITEYDLPRPAFAVGDVGTSIYEIKKDHWQDLSSWQEEIAPDWHGRSWQDLSKIFSSIPKIRLQSDRPAQQNTFKLSYYTPASVNRDDLLSAVQKIATAQDLKISLIFSIDEAKNVGLLDILPASADKLKALQFLRRQLHFSQEQTVFCGDSGNDIPALTSGLNAVMVKNTHPDIQTEVNATAKQHGFADRIYTASGDFINLNGNYAAGVLEGVAHFFPPVRTWLLESK